MKLRFKDYLFLTIVLIGSVFWIFQQFSKDKKPKSDSQDIQEKTVTIKEASLTVQAVSSEQLRRRGLGNIEKIADNEGMLFVHAIPGRYEYTMQDMQFDLDFIFIKDNKVVDIARGISQRYRGIVKGETEYDQVLEVNADWTRKHNIAIGDPVELKE